MEEGVQEKKDHHPHHPYDHPSLPYVRLLPVVLFLEGKERADVDDARSEAGAKSFVH